MARPQPRAQWPDTTEGVRVTQSRRWRAAPRIVIGIGEDSTDQLCDRTSRALAAVLGIQTTFFPGGHIGFAEDPAAFASRLRAVLAAR